MFNMFRVASSTFKESIREPVYCLLLVCAAVLIAHFPAISLFVFYEQLKMVVDSSMATGLVFGLFAAVLTSSHTVTQEMRNGTVLLLLSKPVHRWSFVMAKIIGVVAAVVLMMFILNCATIISVYMAVDQFRYDSFSYYMMLGLMVAAACTGAVFNYFRGNSFSAITVLALGLFFALFAGYCLFFQPTPELSMPDLLKALVLLFGAVAAMATIAVVFALWLDMVPNLCVCSVVFFMGMVSSYLFNRETGSQVLDYILQALYAIFPNWQFFWLADAIAVDSAIPAAYVWKTFIYVIGYIILCSLWAVVLFRRREIAKDSR